jgi:hypothetical protein
MPFSMGKVPGNELVVVWHSEPLTARLIERLPLGETYSYRAARLTSIAHLVQATRRSCGVATDSGVNVPSAHVEPAFCIPGQAPIAKTRAPSYVSPAVTLVSFILLPPFSSTVN